MPYGKKTCPGAGRTCPKMISISQRYCEHHAVEYELRRGTPKERGYDAAHRALRAEWQKRIDAGEVVRCWRCGIRLSGTDWDLGHTDDRTAHAGPECRPCNRAAGGRVGNRRARR